MANCEDQCTALDTCIGYTISTSVGDSGYCTIIPSNGTCPEDWLLLADTIAKRSSELTSRAPTGYKCMAKGKTQPLTN